MQTIFSHSNLDFDGLASLIAAKKLYPEADIILPAKVAPEVNHFLAIYKDIFKFKRISEVQCEKITDLILVDTNSIKRLGHTVDKLPPDVTYHVYDHHPQTEETVSYTKGKIDHVGATITLLTELIQQQNLSVSPLEATLFGLGVYSDTGAFTYENTTSRDLAAAAFHLEQGANLHVIEQFRDTPLTDEQLSLFHRLLDNNDLVSIDGTDIIIAYHSQKSYTGHLSVITKKLLQVTGADAVYSVVTMGNKTFITARADNDRMNVLPVIRHFNGGGHEKAASASVNGKTLTSIISDIKTSLSNTVEAAITAKHIMSSPVRVVAPDTTIETVSKMLYRYGHTGFPVVEGEKVIGIISRRDVDKALHHDLGHAPVKGYMSHSPITIDLHEKISTIREFMIEEHVGRLPVIHKDQLIGIVSRTDIIQAMHGINKSSVHSIQHTPAPLKRQLTQTMKKQLPSTIYNVLKLLGKEAGRLSMCAYLIGGTVRDLLLDRRNEDMDIVVEGDGIDFALHMQERYGGHVRTHETFRTATWKHPNGYKVDLTSARTEYYDFPAALPNVELSTIKEDLYRRDFTINAMAICLHEEAFGELIDHFNGLKDLQNRQLRVLYNLSFVEDPTRLLRAIRFESRFKFHLSKNTERLAHESVSHIHSVSKPRLASELIRLFNEEDPLACVTRMDTFSLLNYLFHSPLDISLSLKHIKALTDWQTVLRDKDVAVHSSIWICYMALLTTMNKESFAELYDFCLTKEDIKTLDTFRSLTKQEISLEYLLSLSLMDLHMTFAHINKEPLIAWFSIFTEKNTTELFHYILKRETLKRTIDGEDLKQAGYQPSPLFKDMLLYSESLELTSPEISKAELLKAIHSNFSVNENRQPD
ncbi:CBS domain-containing protein [Salipaludibacillus sp. LMS25]|jgi:tRNA nucleotidyltransferase (CCA-adding enzyme)|uniref:CBS domain-containing protein n=1 Tax=Salipaludibacillus sp. LMS25 TaxID=2924031 RepID=UPI0020D069C5|nr:CBS domain-containing protein [Salipaludibacillus sp. LMS25]UTR14330.1 CBS domain-containing protein [Salipaludibacillus sp. LMS25]